MARKDFTNSALSLGLLAAAYPSLDHFHGVETVECHDGPRDAVWHYGIIRDDNGVVEVINECGENADEVLASDFDRLVGDEWHETR